MLVLTDTPATPVRGPRFPATRKAKAELPRIIARLLAGETLIDVAAEYAVKWKTLRLYVIAEMTPTQRRTWQHRGRSEGGRRSRKTARVGTVVVRNGRRWIKVSAESGNNLYNWKHMARWKWETLRGPVPVGHVLWPRDGDALNDDPENMELISEAERLRRNVRTSPAVERRRRRGLLNANAARREFIAVTEEKRQAAEYVAEPAPAPELVGAKAKARARLTDFLNELEAA